MKATDASDYRPNGDRNVFEIPSQIAGWEDGTDLDGRTVEIFVKETPTNDNVANTIEEFVFDNTDSDISVNFNSVNEVE